MHLLQQYISTFDSLICVLRAQVNISPKFAPFYNLLSPVILTRSTPLWHELDATCIIFLILK